ncbi:hypothetical protein RM704_10660 [Streptomyces sp. DSM 3412]|uniref:Minor tail protein n=1 Tax=Streptomyces gottesmaniae TaxID=3075518 RepID=A0ABU2YUC8_9ACTN|nr:hypothetical protein [Streptomyces sp. DSM 3412]MDT0567926.1 hypothetical protein [Streptomyces sp. DSM 3412]
MTDAEYEKIAALFSGDGVWGNPTDTAVVAAGTGLSVDVRAGVFASVRGHAWYSGTTAVNLAISSNSSGSTRTDRVVLRLARSTWTVRAVVKEGTPGSGAPTLTQDVGDTGVYEVLLADVTVLNAAAAVTVSRGERYVGSRLRPTTAAALAGLPPTLGDLVYEVDTGRVRIYDGSAYRDVYSYSGAIDVSSTLSGWAVVVTPMLEVRSGVACLRLGQFSRAGGNLSGPNDSRLPILIPAAYRHPTRNVYANCYITGARIGRCTIYPANHESRAGQVWMSQKPDMTNADDVLFADVSWVVG